MNRAVKAASIAALAMAYGLMPAGAAVPDAGAAPADMSDAATGAAPAGTSGRLTIRGRVANSEGRAVPAARMFLEGARREVAPLDRNGGFVLVVPVTSLDSLIREPLSLWLNARRTGWRIGLASGAPRLRMELGAYDDSLGARHVRVRTNDAAVTVALAHAFADGVLADTLDISFAGEPGKDPEPRDVALDFGADILVVPGRVTSYTTPDTTDAPSSAPALASAPTPAPAARDSARRTASSTRSAPRAPNPKPARPAPGTPPVVATTRTTPPAVTPVAPDSCACRIEGTIEVQWDHPLPERVPVALWVEGKPAGRDSVELLLGSPRGFVLLATGCGPHRVAYTSYSRLKFTRLTPDPVIECTDHGQRQLRIVLEPVRPRLPR